MALRCKHCGRELTTCADIVNHATYCNAYHKARRKEIAQAAGKYIFLLAMAAIIIALCLVPRAGLGI